MKIKLDYLLLPSVYEQAELDYDAKIIDTIKLRIFTEDKVNTPELGALLRELEIPYQIDDRYQIIIPRDAPFNINKPYPSENRKLSLSELELIKDSSFSPEEFRSLWLRERQYKIYLPDRITKVAKPATLDVDGSISHMLQRIINEGGVKRYLWRFSSEGFSYFHLHGPSYEQLHPRSAHAFFEPAPAPQPDCGPPRPRPSFF